MKSISEEQHIPQC